MTPFVRLALAAAVFVAASALSPVTARACDPSDATVRVLNAGDDLVFISRTTLTRLGPDGAVKHQRTSRGFGQVQMFDERRLLNIVVSDSEGCTPLSYQFELVDTLRSARPRVLGTLASRTGIELDAVIRKADGSVVIRGSRYMIEEDVDVRFEALVPRRGRLRERRVTAEGPWPPIDDVAEVPPPTPLSIVALEESHGVRVVNGDEAVVTIGLEHWLPDSAFTTDGRYLALPTWSRVNEDYGTGFDARLELLELATGQRRTVVGEGTGITSVEGRVTVSCDTRVDDPESPLNVRSAPRSNARAVGTIPHDTVVAVAQTRGRWARLSAPSEGWVWADHLTRSCRVD